MKVSQLITVRFAKDAEHLAQKEKHYQQKLNENEAFKALRQQFEDLMSSFDSYTRKRHKHFIYTQDKKLANLN